MKRTLVGSTMVIVMVTFSVFFSGIASAYTDQAIAEIDTALPDNYSVIAAEIKKEFQATPKKANSKWEMVKYSHSLIPAGKIFFYGKNSENSFYLILGDENTPTVMIKRGSWNDYDMFLITVFKAVKTSLSYQTNQGAVFLFEEVNKKVFSEKTTNRQEALANALQKYTDKDQKKTAEALVRLIADFEKE